MSNFLFSLNAIKYEDVRAQIVSFLETHSEYSATFDWEGSNIAYIIDTMAYVTMLMSYQATNLANNAFLDTSSDRTNVVSIAKSMGYRPQRIKSAIIDGVIKYYDPERTFTTDSVMKINARSTFISSSGKTFTNLEPIELRVSASNDNLLTGSFSLIEGTFKNYIYLGTGAAYQSFTIPSSKIENNNISLQVRKSTELGGVDKQWIEVKSSFNLISEKIYFVEEDIHNEGFPKFIFGDGVIGKIPAVDEIIEVEYLESNGALGNGDTVLSIPKNTTSYVVLGDLVTDNYVVNIANFSGFNDSTSKSYGGKAYETIDEIRVSAPLAFATAGRAVTKNDFITLLNAQSYIFRGNAAGGDELFPGDVSQLGNIYLTAAPYFETDFLTSATIYLTNQQETALKNEFKQYSIISTVIDFLKPTYLYVDCWPAVEFKNNISVYDETTIKNTIVENLTTYFTDQYTTFNAIFRLSKLNSEIDKIPSVVSSDLTTRYSFIINYNSFYDSTNVDANFMYLPVKIAEYDQYGNVSLYTNFVKTNVEQAALLGLPGASAVPIADRTIYGKLTNASVERYMYNEDVVIDGEARECDIKLFGENLFFSVFRFNSDMTQNDIIASRLKTFNDGQNVLTLIVSQSITGDNTYSYDNYSLTYGDTLIGSVVRNYNRDYHKGTVSSADDILATPTHGQFHEIVNSFEVSGTQFDFTTLTAGETIIYSETASAWVKGTHKGNISAADDAGLYSARTNNEIWTITASSGDFEGRTPSVSAGDRIIFNENSESNPNYKWEKLNFRVPAPSGGFDADLSLPPAAVDYSIKLIENVGIGGTDFGGRITTTLYENDLIIFNAASTAQDYNKWEKLINVASSAEMAVVTEISATDNAVLAVFDYHPVSGVQIGTMRKVSDIGSFPGSMDYIIWPTTNSLDQIAYQDDLLVYVGNSKWRLFARSFQYVFAIDGSVNTALPLAYVYGDTFLVVAGSGSFVGGLGETVSTGDEIVYVGNDAWIKLTSLGNLDPTLAANLPVDATFGDIFYVTEDGNFNSSIFVSPYNHEFIQGDSIIFTGTYWVSLREYSFVYNQITNSMTGRDFLNYSLGFNSVFYYVYDPTNDIYNFMFNDIYNGVKIGSFRYSVSEDEINSAAKYDVGKLKFEGLVSGMYNETDSTGQIELKSIFNNYAYATQKMDKVYVLPKNKRDTNGALLLEQETDFDTVYNQYIVVKVNEITKI